MANRLDTRLSRLEKATKGASADYVVHLRPGETQEQAIDRHRAATGYQGGVMIIPDPKGDDGQSDLTTSEWLSLYAPDGAGVDENKSTTKTSQNDNISERHVRRGE